MSFTVRLATAEDEVVLWQALFDAAHLGDEGHTSLEVAKGRPDLAHYVADWPRPGDLGVVAVATPTAAPVGAAWVRLLTGDERGFGWVDDTIPELAIGLLPGYRGQGIGTALLTKLLELARGVYPGVSLSTRANNPPAVRLYERCGFQKVAGSEVVNWAGGVSYNMVIRF
jgi:ribosomal protein S18 acetylase RimI-like enzyme